MCIPDTKGIPPTHYLTKWGPSSPGVMDMLLLNNYAVVYLRNNKGLMPMDIAEKGDYPEKRHGHWIHHEARYSQRQWGFFLPYDTPSSLGRKSIQWGEWNWGNVPSQTPTWSTQRIYWFFLWYIRFLIPSPYPHPYSSCRKLSQNYNNYLKASCIAWIRKIWTGRDSDQ